MATLFSSTYILTQRSPVPGLWTSMVCGLLAARLHSRSWAAGERTNTGFICICSHSSELASPPQLHFRSLLLIGALVLGVKKVEDHCFSRYSSHNSKSRAERDLDVLSISPDRGAPTWTFSLEIFVIPFMCLNKFFSIGSFRPVSLWIIISNPQKSDDDDNNYNNVTWKFLTSSFLSLLYLCPPISLFFLTSQLSFHKGTNI